MTAGMFNNHHPLRSKTTRLMTMTQRAIDWRRGSDGESPRASIQRDRAMIGEGSIHVCCPMRADQPVWNPSRAMPDSIGWR